MGMGPRPSPPVVERGKVTRFWQAESGLSTRKRTEAPQPGSGVCRRGPAWRAPPRLEKKKKKLDRRR